jgi:hypothetical protein
VSFAEVALAEVHTDYIERIAVDPEYKKMIVKLEGGEASWDEEMKRIFREAMTDNVVTSTRSGIDWGLDTHQSFVTSQIPTLSSV